VITSRPYWLCAKPAVERTIMFRPSPSAPSCRVTMFTTPLIASVPYSADPAGRE
jgi:hypothetical protein